MDWDDWLEKRKQQKHQEKIQDQVRKLEKKLLDQKLRKLSEQKRKQEEENRKRNEEIEQWKKSQEIWKGEYLEQGICSRCGQEGKLKIIYTPWTRTHYAKAECELCGQFHKWIPQPKISQELK